MIHRMRGGYATRAPGREATLDRHGERLAASDPDLARRYIDAWHQVAAAVAPGPGTHR